LARVRGLRLFWFLFILFCLFFLFRLAFFGRRHWAAGLGLQGGHGYGMPPELTSHQEWHKRAHGEQPSGTQRHRHLPT